MHSRKLLYVSARLLMNHWRQSVMTASAFVVGVGSFAAFIGVMTAARADLERLLRVRAAEGRLNITAAQYREIGARQTRIAAYKSLRLSDTEAIRQRLGATASVVAVRARPATIRWRKKRRGVVVVGANAAYFDVAAPPIAAGQSWNDDDARRLVAVISADLARGLFDYEQAVGQQVWIGDRQFTVTGVMAAGGADEGSADDVVVPLRVAPNGGERSDVIERIAIKTKDTAAAAVIARQVLRRERGLRPADQDDFTVRDEGALLASRQRVSDLFRLLLPAIAVVALIAGGVGIVTVMLLAVRERATEIGLRRAIGATRRDIILQFVCESLLLALPSSVVGACLGMMVAIIVGQRSHWPVVVPWEGLLAGIVAAIILSMLCGAVPARLAAKIDPAAALRLS